MISEADRNGTLNVSYQSNTKQSLCSGLYISGSDLHKGPRSALTTFNHLFAHTERDDAARSVGQQAITPRCDSRFFEVRCASSENGDAAITVSPKLRMTQSLRSLRSSSPASSYRQSTDTSILPPAVARNPRRKLAWMKARAQYARDQLIRPNSDSETLETSSESERHFEKTGSAELGPKRKQSAFVKDEELKCLLEDRVGTPHISELWVDDDVSAHLNV